MLQRKDPDEVEDLLLAGPLTELPDLLSIDWHLDESPSLPEHHVSSEDEDSTSDATSNVDDPDEGDGNACPWNQCCPDWTGPVLKIIDWQDAEAAHGSRIARHTGDERRVNAAMALLRARGEYRKLQRIPADWRSQLIKLDLMFPNFGEVIDYVRVMYALAEQGDGVPRFAPMLLNGDPGSGKSYFSEHFAKQFGAGYLCTHLETAQSNSGLSGSADYWNNTKPGDVFGLLVEHDFANAVVLLDEVDKVLSCDYDPLASLYGLLEPGTAKSFRDLSYPWLPPLNASRIIWIATANNAECLPTPILDRFRCFDIAVPTEHQARGLVKQIFRELLDEMPPSLATMRLASATIDVLTTYSPRRVKSLLREGLGRAVLNKRKRVAPRDIPVNLDALFDTRTIGFL